MAVKPQELIQNIEAEVDEIEIAIDMQLRKVKIYHESGVYIDAPKNYMTRHFPSIKERYIKAGWLDVTFATDRDGTRLYFKLK